MTTVQEIIIEVQEDVQDDSIASVSKLVAQFNRCIDKLSREFLLPDLFTTGFLGTSPVSYTVGLPSDFHKNLFHVHSSNQSVNLPLKDSFLAFIEGFPTYDNQETGTEITGIVRNRSSLIYSGIPCTHLATSVMIISFGAATKTITLPTGFGTGVKEKSKISVSGSSSNNGVFTVAGISEDLTAITVTETITDEEEGEPVSIVTGDLLRLQYYRKPIPIPSTEYEDIEPDGIPNELAESLLGNYAVWKLFSKIEQGSEGRKIDTAWYKNEYIEAKKELKHYIDYETPGITRLGFGA